MTSNRESDYYLRISVFNSHKNAPVFNWSQSKGNIALGVAIAKESIEQKMQKAELEKLDIDTSPDSSNYKHLQDQLQDKSKSKKNSYYEIDISIRRDSDNQNVFEVDHYTGDLTDIHNKLDDLYNFVKYKLGFDLVTQVKKAVAGEE
jgi:membrane-bound lytic murein transglycosylase